MSTELEETLIKKYPKIFRQVSLPMTETCMCWGLECEIGWYSIIDNLCKHIQDYVDEGNCKQVEAVQVKQKFGGLRFYTNGADEAIELFIEMAEDESYKICEYCGTTENVGMTQGWNVTCCKDCHAKFIPDLKWSENAT